MQHDKVFLAPYEEIAARAEEVCREQGFTGWVIDYGSLEGGVAKAREYAAKGAKVLVSRSVSASAIMESVAIPVVEIEMGTYDIIMALAKASTFAKRVGILGLQKTIYDSATLGKLLGMEIHEMVVSSFEQINPAIDKAKAIGLEALVAG